MPEAQAQVQAWLVHAARGDDKKPLDAATHGGGHHERGRYLQTRAGPGKNNMGSGGLRWHHGSP